ncbi:hypothetical protein FRB90_001498 [Tulasnella sp. 427]|nr:hypothetical protein FRB90_001498 [Tulasnella sp. 427]
MGNLLSLNTITLGALGLTLLYLLQKYWRRGTQTRFPPGPHGLPLIGNLLDMPQTNFALTYTQWGEKYGPITWITVSGQSLLIINGYDAMSEILDKRGGKYADRARSVMLKELVGLDFHTGLLPSGLEWKKHRSLLKNALSADTVKSEYSELLVSKALEYVRAIMDKPEDLVYGLKRAIGETICELSYGALVDDKDDSYNYVIEQNKHIEYVKRTMFGYVVDLLPALKYLPDWLPGAQFKRDAKRWRKHLMTLKETLIQGVERRMDAKTQGPCYISSQLEELHKLHAETGADIRQNARIVHDTAFSFYQVASDTSDLTLRSFLLAMSLYPDVQAHAREEVDRIVCDGDLPSFEAQDDAPYIHAIVLECLRWNPVAPVGVARCSREDDIYNGYFIPEGTTIIYNLWQISRDPNIYQDPSTFDPSRFVQNSSILDPRDFVFGFGRRACPGKYLAYRMIWIFVVSVLWAFEIRKNEDKLSLDSDVERFESGFFSVPRVGPDNIHCIPRIKKKEFLDKL